MKKMTALLMVLIGCLIGTDALAMLRALVKASPRRVGLRSLSHYRTSEYGIGLLKSSLAAIEKEKTDMIQEKEDLVSRFYQFSDSPHFSKQGQEIAEKAIAFSMINQDKLFWQIGQHEALIGAAAQIWEEESKEKEELKSLLKESTHKLEDVSDISKVRSDIIDVLLEENKQLLKENKQLKQTVVRARSSRFSHKENKELKQNKMVRE